jgi:hypothetical protein
MTIRGCHLKVENPSIVEYLEKLRAEKNKSLEVSASAKPLVDKIIRYAEKTSSSQISEFNSQMAELNAESEKLRDIDGRITRKMDECFKVVSDQLAMHRLPSFKERIINSPSERLYTSPLIDIPVYVSLVREDHKGSIYDMKTRVEGSKDINPMGRETIASILDYYCLQIDKDCKVEDEYVGGIRLKAGKIGQKFCPVNESIGRMRDWMGQIKELDYIEVRK